MQNHVITVQVTIQAEDDITPADIQHDLRDQFTTLQEKAPYRRADGASWWTRYPATVTFQEHRTEEFFVR
jgi:hypothetical protein